MTATTTPPTNPATTTTTTTALPIEAGTYALDENHSGIHFQIRHLGLSNVRGTFKAFDAFLEVGDSLADVVVTATIDLSSVDTNQPDRDAHLLGTDFFSAETHPQMTFRSTAVRAVDAEDYELDGDLTINGITQPVTLEVEFNGSEIFPADGTRHVGFTANAEIKRNDYGIDFNMPLGTGKLALGEKVKVELDLQFVAP
jgi:polyisoprenoid-binding protein YceI